ncbi:hypothetical protein VZT92_014147 [Zoarces viviparus]|uniref:Uncharacterized protein n=1 Tax=Zoarces viviparus TaxID=48416 RepID=A0AAW1EYX1_ZOAVI
MDKNGDDTAEKVTPTEHGDKKGSVIQDKSGGPPTSPSGTVEPGAAWPRPSPQEESGAAKFRAGAVSLHPRAFPSRARAGTKTHRFKKGKWCAGLFIADLYLVAGGFSLVHSEREMEASFDQLWLSGLKSS